ncbi:MAG: polyprenyl synthetase family protein [Erysipelotrichales bacterium]|nr:polyprenyl synthetase family protein [Erysipelotrichales bacterium]
MMSFEEYLRSCFDDVSNPVEEAELYSLLNGGKRVRPNLLFSVLEGCEMKKSDGYPYAAAIEMIHTYSLIHDDLPAMDNDDYRRGKLSNHKVFGEAEAILAGDALLTKAFETAALPHKYAPEMIREIAKAAGDHGMVYGQILDLRNEKNPKAEASVLQEIDEFKTGELLALPLVLGGYLTGHTEDLPLLKKIGKTLGLAFQIQDDILDVTSSKEVLGKSTSDVENGKSTYVSVWGLEKARQYTEKLFCDLYKMTGGLHFDSTELNDMIKRIEARKN